MRILNSSLLYDVYLNSKIQESMAWKVSQIILKSQHKLFPKYDLHRDIFRLYII